MQTNLHPDILATDRGQRADAILRACVHCGFCNATCPTYQLLGDELDGPRGRIYLIKELLESNTVNARAQTHLDRCLTCRACETTCPSGVAYGELLEIGREHLGGDNSAGVAVSRGWFARTLRRGLRWMVPSASRFRRYAKLGGLFRWVLPSTLRRALPRLQPASRASLSVDLNPNDTNATARILLLDGCVQKAATPQTNEHLVQLLQNHNVQVVLLAQEHCCGGATLHLGDAAGAGAHIRALLDTVAPYLAEVDAVLSSASGCGVTLRDYERLVTNGLHADESPDQASYESLAKDFVSKLRDVSEFLGALPLRAPERLALGGQPRQAAGLKVAWHAPCTLQHGLGVTQQVEPLLEQAGYELVPVADAHLCCGSAGTYSVTQPKLSMQLQQQKVAALQQNAPDVIATANVGCQLHISAEAKVPVLHWLQLLE